MRTGITRERRTYRTLHLSDTHLTASGLDMDGADAVGALDRLLHDCRELDGVDLVVHSGDVADDGSVAGCEAARERIGAYAAARGASQAYATGNHDDRSAFGAVLGSGHLAPDGSDAGTPAGDGSCAAVSTVGGLRVVTLDSLVPGSTPGRVGETQLAWLREVLAEPAEDGTLLVLHHPPVWLASHPRMATVVLQDADVLAEVVRDTDVRMVLAGHLHLQLTASWAGVPVWVTPGVVSRIDLTGSPRVERAVVGSSASVVDLGPGPTAYACHLLHARQPDLGRVIHQYDPATGADVP